MEGIFIVDLKTGKRLIIGRSLEATYRNGNYFVVNDTEFPIEVIPRSIGKYLRGWMKARRKE